MLSGKPLIAYTIEESLKSRLLDRLIVSTDSKKIANIAQHYGAEVPFIRPTSLAEDSTPDRDVFIHALSWLDQNEKYKIDILVNLRPTAPFRKAEDIDRAIEIFISSGADFLKSVCMPKNHPYKMWNVTSESSMEPFIMSNQWKKEGPDIPRQKTFPIYWQNAVIDVLNRKAILHKGSFNQLKFCPYIMSSEASVDLDSLTDFEYAEFLIKSRRNTKKEI